jgi:class 3 adenylate cyclase
LHDPSFSNSRIDVELPLFDHEIARDTAGHCVYAISLYRSADFSSETQSSNLILICIFAISTAFVIMGGTFFMYDRFVRRRNTTMVHAAARSNAILSSLFPTQIRDRLFAEKDENDEPKTFGKNLLSSDALGKKWDSNNGDDELVYKSKPIADLFPETTILFADIVGFTAWSSVREPSQVFILLETLFRSFDEIARKRRVFKVETVGDCYVAVTGLPDPRKDHAVVMARFANDCMNRMQSLVKRLEVTLGPDTGDLTMRMGIHSGPVTAGVLRGERSRFQLFGDAMNTAARMEHTGLRDKIQVSQETADLLIAAGKTGWVVQRDDGAYIKIALSDNLFDVEKLTTS